MAFPSFYSLSDLMIFTQRAHTVDSTAICLTGGKAKGNSQYLARASCTGLPPLRETIPGEETSPRRDLSKARAGPDLESLKWEGGAAVTLKAPCRGHEDTLVFTSATGSLS